MAQLVSAWYISLRTWVWIHSYHPKILMHMVVCIYKSSTRVPETRAFCSSGQTGKALLQSSNFNWSLCLKKQSRKTIEEGISVYLCLLIHVHNVPTTPHMFPYTWTCTHVAFIYRQKYIYKNHKHKCTHNRHTHTHMHINASLIIDTKR